MRENDLASVLESALIREYGLLIGSESLWKLLGLPSQQSLNQSVWRGHLPVRLINIPNRRGKFALATDIAAWIAIIVKNQELNRKPCEVDDQAKDGISANEGKS